MWLRGSYGRLEALSCIILVLGVLGDQLSTAAVLSRSGFLELNERAALLISMGLWSHLDLLFMFLGVLIPYLSARLTRFPPLRGLFAYPIIHGILRLGATIWNLSLIFL